MILAIFEGLRYIYILSLQYTSLYLKKPRATECSYFRTIGLMPHTLKIVLKIIQERLSKKIDKEVGKTQFGFRPCSGTREGIFSFNILAQKHLEVDQDMYTCFIDYSKAFDRVHHLQLIQCLERIGIDGKDIRIIGNLYWQQKAAIRIGEDLSPFADIKRGVRQGCVLSPYLFNIYTEFIFRNSDDLEGITINGHNINNLRYADDTALIAKSETKLQAIVNCVKEKSSQAGLDMNINKTIMISRNRRVKAIKVEVNGSTLEQIDQFKYLCIQITVDAKSETEMKSKLT